MIMGITRLNDSQEEEKTKQNKAKHSQFVIDEEKEICYPIRERDRMWRGVSQL